MKVETMDSFTPAPSAQGHGARVEFRGIAKDYGTLRVLQPTTLTIEKGELFAMIGPSGSGKSTLLSILAGFVPPSEGSLLLEGRDIGTLPPYKRDIGMVFQNYALFPHRSVAENIAFPLLMRGLSKPQIREEVERALAMVRLEGMGNRRPSQLSGGQQQRVALARAAVYRPRLLLMDEPLGALDKNLREQMQEEIRAFQRQLGATMVYVTHDQQEAAFLADRLAVMNHGRLEQIGTPRALYDAPKTQFVANFLGEMTTIPLAGAPEQGPAGVMARAASGLELRIPVPEGPVTAIGLRPENIVIGPGAASCDNNFAGRIEEALFTTGTLRYRIRIGGSETVVLVRVPSHPGERILPEGSEVRVGWNAGMSVLLGGGAG